METRLSSATSEIVISDKGPTVLIGERINPTGKRKMREELKTGDMGIIRKEALVQVQAGADVLDVNIGGDGLDEVNILPRAVEEIMNAVEVPLCFDCTNPRALEAALRIYRGKPLISSVTGDDRSLEEILPLVKEYKTVVIGLTMEDGRISNDSDERVIIAHKIVERAVALGIPIEDIVIDCLAQTVGVNDSAGLITIQTIRKIKDTLGVNMTLGASNISFGLPNRNLLNSAFLAIAITAGVTIPIVDIQVRQMVTGIDLVLGRDNEAMRYIEAYRQNLS